MTESTINQAAVDRFTSAHAGVGVTMAAAGLPWWAALVGTVGWELVENHLKDARPDLFPYSSHDSLGNSVADSVAVMAAYLVTRHVTDRGLSPEGKAAYRSAVGSTLGAFAGSISFGGIGHLVGADKTTMERGLTIQDTGATGYQVGCAIGGAVGAFGAGDKHKIAAAIGGLIGGGTLGPLGAALGSYVAVSLAQSLNAS